MLQGPWWREWLVEESTPIRFETQVRLRSGFGPVSTRLACTQSRTVLYHIRYSMYVLYVQLRTSLYRVESRVPSPSPRWRIVIRYSYCRYDSTVRYIQITGNLLSAFMTLRHQLDLSLMMTIPNHSSLVTPNSQENIVITRPWTVTGRLSFTDTLVLHHLDSSICWVLLIRVSSSSLWF